MYMYIYVYMCIYIFIYTYIYSDRIWTKKHYLFSTPSFMCINLQLNKFTTDVTKSSVV